MSLLVVYLAGAVRQAESTWQEEHFAEERRGSNFNVNSLRTSSESAIFPRLFLVCSQVRSVSIAREVKSSDQIAAKRLFSSLAHAASPGYTRKRGKFKRGACSASGREMARKLPFFRQPTGGGVRERPYIHTVHFQQMGWHGIGCNCTRSTYQITKNKCGAYW